MLKRWLPGVVLLLTACSSTEVPDTHSPVKLLEAAKRGAPTDSFWEGGQARSELFNVTSFQALEPKPASGYAVTALARRQKAQEMAADELVEEAKDADNPAYGAALKARAAKLRAESATPRSPSLIFRARVTSTTRGGQQITKTWLFPMNAAGLVTDIIDETEEPSAEPTVYEVMDIKLAVIVEVRASLGVRQTSTVQDDDEPTPVPERLPMGVIEPTPPTVP